MEQPASPTTSTATESTPSPSPILQHPRLPPAFSRPVGRGVGALARGSLLTPGAGNVTRIPPTLQAKMAEIAARNTKSPSSSSVDRVASVLQQTTIDSSSRRPPPPPSLATKRRPFGLKLADMDRGDPVAAAGLGAGRPINLNDSFEFQSTRKTNSQNSMGTPFSNFHKIVDPSGALKFGGKAILHASGVDFSNGSSFAINMGELDLQEELGKGNYGTVKKVRHKPTNVLMAMKEIRLELDDSKLNAIIMELDILHRATSSQIVEFYGAFFIESCVYYCMEYMDAGSLDKLVDGGVDEDVLARITHNVVKGLKFLKDSLQIIHRDVKPTNVLINRRGDVKLCDFGVSGQLEKSLAKTNIGCQSYMAASPERIKGESQDNAGTYTVTSDVWSLGLTILELAMGTYPYPPETYSNVFAQLQAIVHGPPPEMPERYSDTAREFVGLCMMKEPAARATYAELLEHPFLFEDRTRIVDMVGWVAQALEHREKAQIIATEQGT